MADGKVTRRSILSASPPPTVAESPQSAGAVIARETGMSVVVIDDLTALEKYVPAWEDLAAAAIEPNVFYSVLEQPEQSPAIHSAPPCNDLATPAA